MKPTTTEQVLSKLRELYPSASPERQQKIVKLANLLKSNTASLTQITEIARIVGLDRQEPITYRQLKCLEIAAEIKEKRKPKPPHEETPDEVYLKGLQIFSGK